jgi:hypothetical protein
VIADVVAFERALARSRAASLPGVWRRATGRVPCWTSTTIGMVNCRVMAH